MIKQYKNVLDGITMEEFMDAIKNEKNVTARTVSAILFSMIDDRVQEAIDTAKENIPDILMATKAPPMVDDFTEGYELDEIRGIWRVVDSTWYRDKKFYLMKAEQDPDYCGPIAVDENGKLVAEELYDGFDCDFEDAADEYFDENKFKGFGLIGEEDMY
nr:MAG TPA: Large polyvalent protein-associated domain 18 [Caudoviricetes sp.]